MAEQQAAAGIDLVDPAATDPQRAQAVELAGDLVQIGKELSKAEKAKPKSSRPSDDEILGVLAMHYRVHESKVIEWIITMDMESAARRSLEAV